MVEGEVEGGLDDQLIDEAILWKERKREGGNWEEEEERLDRMMKRKSVRARR